MKKTFIFALLLIFCSATFAQTQAEKSYVLDLKYTLKSDSFELLGIELVNSDSPNYVLDSADYYFEFNNAQDAEKFFFNVPNVVYSEPNSDINMFDEQGNQIYFPDASDIITKEEVTEFTIVAPYFEEADKLIVRDVKGNEKLNVDLSALKAEKKLDAENDESKGKGFDFNKDILKNPVILPILLIVTLIVAIIFLRELKKEEK